MRQHMIDRELPNYFRGRHPRYLTSPHHLLDIALSSYLPAEFLSSRTKQSFFPIGSHLVLFNPALPEDQLLPDGTDTLHSPGEPFVRRMWAGGSLRIDKERYWDSSLGWVAQGVGFDGIERIKDVTLRGEGDATKLFVTIERRFGRTRQLAETATQAGIHIESRHGRMLKEAQEGVEWGHATVVEERNIVFMKKVPKETLELNEMAPTKYLTGLCPRAPATGRLTDTPSARPS